MSIAVARTTWIAAILLVAVLASTTNLRALNAMDEARGFGITDPEWSRPRLHTKVRSDTTDLERDSLALVTFYNELRGHWWNDRSGWLEGPLESWIGVTVSSGRVTRLELAGNAVLGHIPPDIGALSELQVLDLQSNDVFVLPAEMTGLTNLEQLLLSDNSIRDLPDFTEISRDSMSSLSLLDVSLNRLTFDDIEPYAGASFTFLYADQRRVEGQMLERGAIGDSLILHVTVGGMYNQYQWYKDGAALAGETNDTYIVPSVTLFDTGTYEVEITNTLVTDLTLWSNPTRFSLSLFQWLDIGAYHHLYAEAGARPAGGNMPQGMEYPAILRHSGHIYGKGLWIGVKNWTDPQHEHFPYYVARIGPGGTGSGEFFPVQNKLIGRYDDTVVEVNGIPSFDKEAILDEIDPGIAADRMIHNIQNTSLGITVDRKIYAYTNEHHDNYHVIAYAYCNTGNTDGDEEIELPDQTLHDVRFLRIHRWRGNEQAAWVTRGDQVWGRYTMHDVVGDGHEEYPVDFTAQYAWVGHDPTYSTDNLGLNNLGAPLYTDHNPFEESTSRPELHDLVAEGDSVGRLSGSTMVGRSTIHADRSTIDRSYDRDQPTTMSWMDNDKLLPIDNGVDPTQEDYYELGILSRENPARNPDCTSCFTRSYPHFADRRQPNGEFWNDPQGVDLLPGGFSPSTGYGPYEMAPGECVHIVVSEGIAGLSFDAATKIGRDYVQGGTRRDALAISHDANGDGVIDTTPFDYDRVFVATEAQTKNQWVMTGRDSLFKMFYRARDLYTASNNMTVYPITEPPRAPTRFRVFGGRDDIALSWTPASNGPEIDQWELFRTEQREDNLYVNGCLEDASIPCGYELVATLPVSTTDYIDSDVDRGVDYFYYIQGVGQPQAQDPIAITGTPGGVPLRSSRYLTQTYTPVALTTSTDVADERPPGQFALHANYPNPFSRHTTIQYELPIASEVELIVYDILGREVNVFIRQHQEAGRHDHIFEASRLSSGVYIYVLRAGDQRAERAMLVVK